MELIKTCNDCLEGDVEITQVFDMSSENVTGFYEIRWACASCKALGKENVVTKIERKKPELKLIKGGK